MLKILMILFGKTSRARLIFSSLIAGLFILPAAASIIGGDLNSIIGGDAKFIAANDFIAVGRVESVDRSKNLVVVLGQTYTIERMTRISIAGKLVSSQGTKVLNFIRAGAYIAVGGVETSAGKVTAARIAILSAAYVDGSSLTYVKGRIGWLDTSIGRLTVGSLQVDYTFSLDSLDASQLAVGRTIELRGIRPLAAGAMLAFSAKIAQSDSIIGGDANSIIGGDVNSIIGGDLNSIIGGDAT